MRILWVKMGGLWPSTTGGRVRSLHTIAELSQRHQVTVVTTHGVGDDPEGLARHLSNCDSRHVVPVRGPEARQRRLPAARCAARGCRRIPSICGSGRCPRSARRCRH